MKTFLLLSSPAVALRSLVSLLLFTSSPAVALRRLVSFLLLTLSFFLAQGQTPAAFNYQAVARLANGSIISSQSVSFRISIHKTNTSGLIVFSETHHVMTNKMGLVTLEIGKGTPILGTLLAIDWGIDQYFLQVELDPTGGTNYILSGISQLLPVPYALFAENVRNNDDADADSLNEIQTLTYDSSTFTLSKGGGYVTLINNDNDSLNEIQKISKTGNVISLSKNGDSVIDENTTYKAGSGLILTDTVFSARNTSAIWNANQLQNNSISTVSPKTNEVLKWNGTAWIPSTDEKIQYTGGSGITINGTIINANDNSATNELQFIQLSNDTLYLSNGGYVVLGDYAKNQAITDLYLKLSNDSSYFKGLINNNQSNITTNTASISTNTSNVTTNTANISGNTQSINNLQSKEIADSSFLHGLISSNTTNLSNHVANDLDVDSTNELQTLSVSNDTIFLSKSNKIKLPVFDYITDADGDTKITVDLGNDEDLIRFYNKGVEYIRFDSGRMKIFNNGNSVFIGDGAGNNDDLTSNDNVFIGYNSGYSNSTGYSNVAIGNQALNKNTVNNNLVAIGDSALYYNGIGASGPKEAYFNTAVGSKVLLNNTTGYWNTAFGTEAMYSNTTGFQNSAFGGYALLSNTTGYNNTACGETALSHNTTGDHNTAVGVAALQSNTSGFWNTALGVNALHSNTTGNYNTASGLSSLYSNTLGSFNTAVGNYSLYSNTTGSWNTATGYYALKSNTTGNSNTGTSHYSLFSNTSGSYNVASGNVSLYSNTTGSYNIGFGYRALYNNTVGTSNVAIGFDALFNNEIGNKNVAVGQEALNSSKSSRNTALGFNAGYKNTGNGSVFIGHNAGYFETGSNKLYISNTTTNNPLIYGEFDNKIIRLNSSLRLMYGIAIDEFSTDGYLAGNSDLSVPTEKAVKSYVDYIDAFDNDKDSINEIQSLSRSDLYISLSKTTGSISIADDDNDSINELQNLSISNDSLFLTKGNSAFLDIDRNDRDSTNELQTLTYNNDTLTLSNGNSVNLPFSTIIDSGTCIITSNINPPTGYIYSGKSTSTDHSEVISKLPSDRINFACDTLGGKIYVAGGQANLSLFEQFDPQTLTWTTKKSMNTGKTNLSLVSFGGKLYAIAATGSTSSFEVYDPSTNNWSTLSSPPYQIITGNHSAAVYNDKIYVFGTSLSSNPQVQIYDPIYSTWAIIYTSPPITYSDVVLFNNKFYCVGGSNKYSFIEFNPITNTWSSKTPLIFPNNLGGDVFVLNNKIYVVDGDYSSGFIQEYDFSTNKWSIKNSTTFRQNYISTAVIDNMVYILGGDYNTGYGNNHFNTSLVIKVSLKEDYYIHCKN